ncbi:MAG: hypothetical protein U1C33_05095, partial [Candidatus Cloacimonadaceae bacterium]|nr:hypothetical protein [Candidatus Cloacimonadaceae bacterium]
DATQYQRAIDLYVEIAGDHTEIERVFGFYVVAWTIADSLMNDKAQTIALQDQFIAQHPGSLYAFDIRLKRLEELAKTTSSKPTAAEGYLVLHDEVRNRRINFGETKPEDLLNNAVALSDYDKTKQMGLMEQYIQLYPQNQRVNTFITAMAIDANDRGDTERYDRLARQLYERDPKNNILYMATAERELKKVLDAYNQNIKEEKWQDAFAKRDEFRRLEARYIRDGLSFSHESIHASFAAAETRYREIQARIAFLRDFDTKLNNIERAALAKPVEDIIRINAITTIERNLVTGNRRLEAVPRLAATEVAKVDQLINQSVAQGLDPGRIVRSYIVKAKIYDYFERTLRTRMAWFQANSNEMRQYRPGTEDHTYMMELTTNYTEHFAGLLRFEALKQYLNAYDNGVLAGYRDANTEIAVAKLKENQLDNVYIIDDHLLDGSWNMSLKGIDDGATRQVGRIEKVTSPMGVELSQISIPAKHTLVLQKTVKNRISPMFGYIQLVHPDEVRATVNGNTLAVRRAATDTLNVTNPLTVREAGFFTGEAFVPGENQMIFEFDNDYPEASFFAFSLRLVTDRNTYEQATPMETFAVNSSLNWRAMTADSTGVMVRKNVVSASNYGIDKADIDGMEDSQAMPIWIPETPDSMISEVVFEVDFDIDTEFRNGRINASVPDEVSVFINGVEVVSNYLFDYDENPMLVYPLMHNINAANIQKGRNTIQFRVKNSSQFRGLMADIQITKVGKEGGI